MKKSYIRIAVIIFSLIVIHYTLVQLGFYKNGIPVDIPQHIAGGAVFAYIGFEWISVYREKKLPKLLVFYTISSFALFSSFLWELLEFSFINLTPHFAEQFYLYSNTASDLLSDLLCGLIGGLVVALSVIYKKDSSTT